MLQQLYAIHGDKLVLSLEMFEADNQFVLNEYLAGRIYGGGISGKIASLAKI